MKNLLIKGSFLLLCLSFWASGCVSSKKLQASEWMRERYVQENFQLKQDTTRYGLQYRNTLKTNNEMVLRLGQLIGDTARLNRHVNLIGNFSEGNSKEEMRKLLEKEKMLNEKEAKLIAKEMSNLENSPKTPTKEPLSQDMEMILEVVKVQLGSYGADKVSIFAEKNSIVILLPNELVFEGSDKNVKGKGLSILIKLAESLKELNYNSFNITTTLKKESNNGTLIYDARKLCGLRGLETASVLERYGILPQKVITCVKLVESTALNTEIRIQ